MTGNPKVTKASKEKIPVTFNETQLELIDKYFGILGNTKAEIIRNIVINWILEKEGKK
ncbi:MAG TPA: CopG family transcriptional regulator [Candidatus Nanoarchaeia archaeon]|nr:CopG family transcriptional regulator [Candidatus Nanoarchaeia archaeon]